MKILGSVDDDAVFTEIEIHPLALESVKSKMGKMGGDIKYSVFRAMVFCKFEIFDSNWWRWFFVLCSIVAQRFKWVASIVIVVESKAFS